MECPQPPAPHPSDEQTLAPSGAGVFLFEGSPRAKGPDSLRAIESIRDAVIRERVAEAAKQMEEQVEQMEQKRRERAARSEGTSTN